METNWLCQRRESRFQKIENNHRSKGGTNNLGMRGEGWKDSLNTREACTCSTANSHRSRFLITNAIQILTVNPRSV